MVHRLNGNTAVRTQFFRRLSAVILGILSALLLWFGLFIAGPWFLRNPPGPNNSSLGWYLLFQMFPLTLLTAVVLLLVAAYKIWRHAIRRDAGSVGRLRGPGEP
jgi:hypothetical protein